MRNIKKKVIKAIRKQAPHTLSDILAFSGFMVPERHPPSTVFEKTGTKQVSIGKVKISVPIYKRMHGSEYYQKHKKRLEKNWIRKF